MTFFAQTPTLSIGSIIRIIQSKGCTNKSMHQSRASCVHPKIVSLVWRGVQGGLLTTSLSLHTPTLILPFGMEGCTRFEALGPWVESSFGWHKRCWSLLVYSPRPHVQFWDYWLYMSLEPRFSKKPAWKNSFFNRGVTASDQRWISWTWNCQLSQFRVAVDKGTQDQNQWE